MKSDTSQGSEREAPYVESAKDLLARMGGCIDSKFITLSTFYMGWRTS